MLRFTSCMAANSDAVCHQIAQYIGNRLSCPTEFVGDIPWQAREQALDQGQIQVGWICGLPYVRKADQALPMELLAAPLMQGEHYQNQPVYFSDVVVRRDSPWQNFDQLQGTTWAYNEPGSHSGYYLTRYTLANRGKASGFFGQVIESGAHQKSLQLVLAGAVDASAIDSTVLELELQRQPELAAQIRIIDRFGPSPIPPWVISTAVAPTLRSQLRQAFLEMHTDPEGRAILAQGLIARFAAVTDADYDPIRQMAQQAEAVLL
ncbi:MAG: PhnD/SsuA/transferrin family substrate-binding protein [Elainella sp.]